MKNILVIEDDTSLRELIKTTLEKAGYNVTEAANGEEGCWIYHQQPFDLVIMDLFLPKKDGLQAIYELKEEYSKLVKIIAISGVCSEGRTKHVLEKAKEYGADAVMKKPLNLKGLLIKVEEVLA